VVLPELIPFFKGVKFKFVIMKIRHFYFFLLTFFGLTSKAHDFQSVYAHLTALFENSSNHRIYGLRIDSVKVAADTILYPFATIQEVSEGCFSPQKSSWIGEKVVVKPDGVNLFFNREGGIISLKTRAKINETWTAFQRSDAFIVEARVQAVELGNVLGLSDSVKTIAFRVLDQQGSTVDHALNKLKVKISKKHGFVETLNFYLFPDVVVRYPADRLEKYTLAGLATPKVGVQNLSWLEVNDFNPGDELHVQEHRMGDPYFYLPIREYDNRCIYKYLERTKSADSVVYRYARKQSIKTVYTYKSTLETLNDTLRAVVRANPSFDQLPGEPILNAGSAQKMYMRNDEFRMKIRPSAMDELYVNSESGNCWSAIAGEGCLPEMRYVEGLGGPYYQCNGYMGDSEERKLVYFRKGQTEWGEKLALQNTLNSILDPSLKWNIGVQCMDRGPYNPYNYWKTTFQKIEGDTVVNTINYKKFVSCSDSLCHKKTLKSLVREDSGKIYLASPAKEFVLFDFNLKKGENMIMSLPYTQYFIRVDSVKTGSLADNKNRKFQYVTVFDYHQGRMGTASKKDIFVEGVGSLNFGLDYPWWFFITGDSGCFQSLLCFYSSGKLIYSNPKYNNCYLNTASKQLPDQPELITVSAAREGYVEILVKDNISGKISIFDLSGKQIKVLHLNQSTTQVCLPSAGIYLYRFESSKGKLQMGKVILK
jgi:hypothetical protein